MAEHRQHAELPRGDVVLFGQFFIKHGRAGIEQPHKETEALFELQRTRGVLRTMRVNAVNSIRKAQDRFEQLRKPRIDVVLAQDVTVLDTLL